MAYTITEKCTGCTVCTTVCPAGVISGDKKKQHIIDSRYCVNCGACGRICPAGAVLDDAGNLCQRVKRSEWEKPVISLKACAFCASCVHECPAGCLAMDFSDERYEWGFPCLAEPKKCIACGWCADICGFDAINMMVIKKEAAAV